MTIAEARTRCKSLLARIPRDAAIVLAFILACSASFGMGIFAGRGGQGTSFSTSTRAPETQSAAAINAEAPAPQEGSIVASKNGTKYYLSTCSGASRISAANKITFASVAAAQAAGYSAAANCKGI